MSIDLSVLIPVFNEVDNVDPLYAELNAVLSHLPLAYEMIFVDDGSTDGTGSRLEAIQRGDCDHVRVVFLRRNCGQTAAHFGRSRPCPWRDLDSRSTGTVKTIQRISRDC